MFSNLNKSAFGGGSGSTSFGFGAQGPVTNPFAQSQLPNKPTSPGGSFGAAVNPAFGQSAAASNFPNQQQQSGLFQNTGTSFATQPSAQTTFGTNIFGQQQSQPSTSGLFGTSAFSQQNKRSNFGCGNGSFGQQQSSQQGSSVFPPSGTANVFGQSHSSGNSNTSGQNGTLLKFSAVVGTDIALKNGVTSTINTKHQCITAMKEYEGKSLEELRYEDYAANRKGPRQQSGFASNSFGTAATSTPSLFGQTENKPTFGQSSMGFGQTSPTLTKPPASFGLQTQQNSAGGLFGKASTGFGATPSTGTGFQTNNPTNSMPFGQTQQSKSFGTATQSLFGSMTSSSNGLVGQSGSGISAMSAKPVQPASGFGAAQATGFSFSQQSAMNTMLQTPKPSTGLGLFGQTSTNTGFANFSQQQSGLSTNSFAKPLTQNLPSNQSLGTAFTSSLQQPGASLFANTGGQQNSLFGPVRTDSGLFSGTTQISGGPTNSQATSLFPAEQPVDLSAISRSPFPVSPHFAGLSPSITNWNYTTNPSEIRGVLETNLNITYNSPKLRVGSPKESFYSGLVEGLTNHENNSEDRHLMRRQKSLLIKTTKEKTDSLFSDADEELLEEIKKTRQKPVEVFEDEATARSKSSTEFDRKGRKSGDNGEKLREDLNSACKLTLSPTKESDLDVGYTPKPVNRSPNEVDVYPSPPPKDRNKMLSPNEGFWCPFCDHQTEFSPKSRTGLATSTPKSSSKNANESHEKVTKKKCAGVILKRPDYFTVPPLEELDEYVDENGSCIIKGFTIGRIGYGNVYFPDAIDVANLNLDELVWIRHREITIYKDDNNKPPLNHELNRRAQVTLDHVYPKVKETNKEIKNPDLIMKSGFVEKLKQINQSQGTKFLEYRPETGSWVFDVTHF